MSIKASELRIGNWVSILECGINARVDVIGENKFCINVDGIDLGRDSTDFLLSSANGIPITPDIFKKCGFEEMGGNYWFNDVCIRRCEDENNKTIYCFDWECSDFSTYIDYLHELQNLYHALTNEELTINL